MAAQICTRQLVPTLLGLVLITSAGKSGAVEQVLLRRTLKKGMQLRAKVVHDIQGQGSPVRVVDTIKATITDVRSNGTFTATYLAEAGTTSVDGKVQKMPQGVQIRQTRDQLGKLLDLQVPASASLFTPAVSRLLMSAGVPIFKSTPVRAGESWMRELPNEVSPSNRASVKTTFVGYQKKHGRRCWKLRLSAEAVVHPSGLKAKLDGIYWIDSSSGVDVAVEIKAQNVPLQGGVIHFRETMKLIEVIQPSRAPR